MHIFLQQYNPNFTNLTFYTLKKTETKDHDNSKFDPFVLYLYTGCPKKMGLAFDRL